MTFQRSLLFLLFLDTFRVQTCPETVKRQNPLKYSKNLVKSPVSGHFPYSKVSGNSKTTKSLEIWERLEDWMVQVMKGFSKELVVSMFIDTFRIQKCLETVKRRNPLKCSKNLVKSPVSGHFPYSKVSRKSKTTKSLEVFKEFGQISCFWTLSVFKRVWKQQNDKIP